MIVKSLTTMQATEKTKKPAVESFSTAGFGFQRKVPVLHQSSADSFAPWGEGYIFAIELFMVLRSKQINARSITGLALLSTA
jgi:hypothetical protein